VVWVIPASRANSRWERTISSRSRLSFSESTSKNLKDILNNIKVHTLLYHGSKYDQDFMVVCGVAVAASGIFLGIFIVFAWRAILAGNN
jgi:hypothetical protein